MEKDFFIKLLIASLLIGLAVLILKPNYSICNNCASNANYYPHVVDTVLLKAQMQHKIGSY